MLCSTFSVFGQAIPCPSAPPPALTAADKAYSEGHYADAESLYVEALAQRPKNPELTAALVRTLLHEGKISQASALLGNIPPDELRSGIMLTSLAEIQFRQGLPWLAMKSLDAALAVNPCNARSHLVRSRVMRIDSMYASEREEIQRAFEIDPADPDIQRGWKDIVSSADELKRVDQSHFLINDLDAKSRQTANATIRSLMSRLSENTQTCQVLPTASSAILPLLPLVEDKKQHVYRYGIEAQLPQRRVKLLMDTAASGLYISRSMAEQNDLHPDLDAPQDTVHVDIVNIGPLTFRNCTVGVSDTPFPDKADGIIGLDTFASYLTTLDFRSKHLTLALLAPQPGLLPGDRAQGSQFKEFIPVYRRQQYLLVPITVDNKSRALFVLGTGMPYTAMASELAHEVSNSKMDFTEPELTASGVKEEFYRDNFDLQLASLPLIQHRRLLQFDLSDIDRKAGFQVAGILGLDILHSMVVHLDYRDGLVKFDLEDQDLAPIKKNGTSFSMELNGAN